MIKTITGLKRKLSYLTDNNWHNESVLLLAEFIKDEKAINEMKEIIKLHEKYGSMPCELIEKRMGILNRLIKESKLDIDGCF